MGIQIVYRHLLAVDVSILVRREQVRLLLYFSWLNISEFFDFSETLLGCVPGECGYPLIVHDLVFYVVMIHPLPNKSISHLYYISLIV